MADGDVIAEYVRVLEASLRRAGRPTEPLVDEARAHLHEDAARIAVAEGCGDAEAARRAVARFGGVGDVMRAVRKNQPMAGARLARVAIIAVLLVLAWEVIDAIVGGDLWPLSGEDMWLTFVAELALVSIALWRALGGARVPAWLAPALAANGALGLALLVAEMTVNARLPSWPLLSVSRAGGATPLWLAMALQGAAGLRALRQQATQAGQPSLPVELQPPG
jgi:hypothetical protein